ncbi:MAG: hypothetical protein SRB1_02009 [Desulfobacteraceae bacterium Eth-SRB1]|nr:MAG: hypothetical protein SRB1_02009 [Desulfobacteraceae bacterium Eth-SRB1]
MKYANIILGSYVNGYSIIQELSENGVPEIIVMDADKDVSAYSKKIRKFIRIGHSAESIFSVLKELSATYDTLILYPNQDIYVEYLCRIFPKIQDFCSVGFNPDNAIEYQDKMVQHKLCRKLGIPCPNVILINKVQDLNRLNVLSFPILIKPTKRDNLCTNVFRNLLLQNEKDVESNISNLSTYIEGGVSFIASEVIPGDGSNIYAYTGYRSKEGEILGEWIGKKLSQFPDDYGVFASASNQAPNIVLEQGQKLLHGMDLWGINEPEFKFDSRDGLFKLMEINLRPMMWHRVGALSGVPLNYIQYLQAVGRKIPDFKQEQNKKIHFIYLNHELINLFRRKHYFKFFKYNLFKGDKRIFALWDKKDLLPFFYGFIGIIKKYKRYRIRNKNANS